MYFTFNLSSIIFHPTKEVPYSPLNEGPIIGILELELKYF